MKKTLINIGGGIVKKQIITVIGSYAVGMTMCTKIFPTAGETLIGHSFKQFHGGKGSNQAVECARLGAEVNFIVCIGKDNFGDGAVKLYQDERINTAFISRSNTLATGVGFITINESGQNIITLDLGANADLTPLYISSMADIISKSDIVLMQLEIPPETVSASIKIAREKGVKTILNPAPYQHLPDNTWAGVTIATPNEKEAKLILNLDPEKKVSIQTLGEGLLNKGIENIIITLGDKGAYFATNSSNTKNELIPVRKVEVVDTTGAGDTFSAALAVAIAEGRSIMDAIKFSCAAATLSVMKYGVIDSMPYRDAVEKELKNQ